MAGSASPFDLLPDEVLAQILARVNERERNETHRNYVRHFIWAQSTCKRWLKAGYMIKDTDWVFDNEDTVLSLANFLQHEGVSLETLRLQAKSLNMVRYKLLFTNAFKKSVPPALILNLLPNGDNHPNSDLKEVLHLMLTCPSLQQFAIVDRSGYPCNHLKLKQSSGISRVTRMILRGLVVSKLDLDGLLKFCPHLTELELAGMEAYGEWDEIDLDSGSLKKLMLHFTTDIPRICLLNAPFLETLETNIDTLVLNTSSLKTLCTRVTDSEVIFTAPVELQNLQLQSICSEYWKYVKSIVKLPNRTLKHLELQGDVGTLEEELVPILELLEILPDGLETLSLSEDFFEGIQCNELSIPLPVHRALKSLTIEVVSAKVQLSSLFVLRKLREAFPGLTNLKLVLPPGVDKVTRFLLKEEARDINVVW